jgi:hypothetical protein
MSASLTPRADRWADTLTDLAAWHTNGRLARLAQKVREENVDRGIELTPAEERSILQASSDALKKED